MIQTKESYVEGSVARKLEYDVYEENNVLKAKKKIKSDNRGRLRIISYVAVMFSLGFILMYRYALITEISYDLSRLERHYTEIKNENSRLKVSLETETDLSRVKQYAKQKLGMQEPDTHQIVYINIPKSDCTEISKYYCNLDSKNESAFAMLMDKVSRFARLLY